MTPLSSYFYYFELDNGVMTTPKRCSVLSFIFTFSSGLFFFFFTVCAKNLASSAPKPGKEEGQEGLQFTFLFSRIQEKASTGRNLMMKISS